MNQNWQSFIDLLHEEVVPALGCTEPVAVALTAAQAAETLGFTPERLEVEVSANLLKNGMGVIVPGTGSMGLSIAAAAGALGGRSSLGLECLRHIDESQVAAAKALVEAGSVEMFQNLAIQHQKLLQKPQSQWLTGLLPFSQQ